MSIINKILKEVGQFDDMVKEKINNPKDISEDLEDYGFIVKQKGGDDTNGFSKTTKVTPGSSWAV